MRSEQYAGVSYQVRRVGGRNDGDRDYRCPGCQQSFSSSLAHVVVWPQHSIAGMGGLDDRRHWHTGCWTARDRRPPPGAYR